MYNDNGIITKIWGPHGWTFLHSITFDYPENPTEQNKADYRKFFELLGNVLPCEKCRQSYTYKINNGITKLDDNVLKNRESLTKWFYYIHEAVNNDLKVDYGVSYKDVVQRYESYRASCGHSVQYNSHTNSNTNKNSNIGTCDVRPDNQQHPYNIANISECRIISAKLTKHFVKYARMRGLPNSEFYLANNLNTDMKKDNDLWNQRNIECKEIINKMRIEGIPSLESDGKWKDLPTIDELKLILRLSSNLSNEMLIKTIQKLPQCKCEFTKIYRLTS